MLDGLLSDGFKRLGFENELGILVAEHERVLLHERILRLGKDTHEVFLVQLRKRGDDRDTTDEFRDHAILMQVFGQHLSEQSCVCFLLGLGHVRSETDVGLTDALCDDLRQADERTAEDEQDVRGIDRNELLLRMLATTLWRDACLAAFHDLQQCLLHAFTRNVARDRNVFSLACDLVDLVDVDDADLGARDIEICCRDELEQDVLNILTYIARFGERSSIGNSERHLERARERLREQRLT